VAVFWDVAPCALAEIYRRFRGAYCLRRHGDEIIMEEVSTNQNSINF
jgi:hypothetical protein